MSILGSIIGALGSAAGSFLSGTMSGAGSALGTAAGNSIFQGLSGGITRVRAEDVEHHQNMADRINPREIARQSQFLTGIAPAQAQAYNTYQDATFQGNVDREISGIQQMTPVRAQADLDYMDTVYAGTSPWERLGSSAAAPINVPGPAQGAPQSQGGAGAGMAQLTPLLSTMMQTEAQKQTAFLNAMTQMQINKQNTADGQLPQAQVLSTLSDAFLKQSQSALTEEQTTKTKAETTQVEAQTEQTRAQTALTGVQTVHEYSKLSQTRIDSLIKIGSFIWMTLPTHKANLGLYTMEAKEGGAALRDVMAKAIVNKPGEAIAGNVQGPDALADAIKGLPREEQIAFLEATKDMATEFGNSAQAGMQKVGEWMDNFKMPSMPKFLPF